MSDPSPRIIVDPQEVYKQLVRDPHSLIIGKPGRGCARHTIILEHIGAPPREEQHEADR